MVFDAEIYQPEALISELLLIEKHCKDGSAAKAHCSCIQDKHMRTVIALADESVPLTKDPAKKNFYFNLSEWGKQALQGIYDHIKRDPTDEQEIKFYDQLDEAVREWRVSLMDENWKVPNVKVPLKCGCKGCVPCQK